MQSSHRRSSTPVDVAIIGGGVAGLWLLARLRALHYNACLIESRALGTGQTIASQGIIHGGAKYALLGRLTHSARTVRQMPGRWRDALAARGELDLSGAVVASQSHCLFSTGAVASGVAAFLASSAMSSRARHLSRDESPEVLRDSRFLGRVYQLDEIVIDVPSTLRALARLVDPWRLMHATTQLQVRRAPDRTADRAEIQFMSGQAQVTLMPRCIVLCAGAGNEALLGSLSRPVPVMQRRPLHMVMVKGNSLPPLFAHALGLTATPRLTVTTHLHSDGSTVWYIGGDIAESGVSRNDSEQIVHTADEIREVLPWINLESTAWATLRIDRAEMRQEHGRRPDDSTIHAVPGLITLWPTKLALAPRAADLAIEALQSQEVTPAAQSRAEASETAPDALPPPVADPPWETVTKWAPCPHRPR